MHRQHGENDDLSTAGTAKHEEGFAGQSILLPSSATCSCHCGLASSETSENEGKTIVAAIPFGLGESISPHVLYTLRNIWEKHRFFYRCLSCQNLEVENTYSVLWI